MIRKLATLALVAAAFYASAQIGANASDVEGARAKFREMDTNGDRALQFSEIQAARGRIFDRMDVNGNGVLDAGEIETVRKVAQSGMRPQPGGMFDEGDIAERMKLIDTDHDGRISRAEFVAFLPQRLKAADKNGDRALSMRELRSLKRAAAPAVSQ